MKALQSDKYELMSLTIRRWTYNHNPLEPRIMSGATCWWHMCTEAWLSK